MGRLTRCAPAALMTAALLLAGCSESESKDDAQQTGVEDVAKEMGETAETAKQAIADAKDRAIGRVSTEYEELEEDLDALEDRYREMADSAGATADRMMERLGEQREAVEEKLEELRAAGSDAWQGVSKELGEAMDELRDAYGAAREAVTGARES